MYPGDTGFLMRTTYLSFWFHISEVTWYYHICGTTVKIAKTFKKYKSHFPFLKIHTLFLTIKDVKNGRHQAFMKYHAAVVFCILEKEEVWYRHCIQALGTTYKHPNKYLQSTQTDWKKVKNCPISWWRKTKFNKTNVTAKILNYYNKMIKRNNQTKKEPFYSKQREWPRYFSDTVYFLLQY